MVSAVVMMAIAVLTGMLTTQVKTHEAIKAESEKRTYACQSSAGGIP